MNIYGENELDTPLPRKQLGLSSASACVPPCTCPGLRAPSPRGQPPAWLGLSHVGGGGVWETEPGPRGQH